MNGIESLSLSLIRQIYDTQTLSQVSTILESLASNRGFKMHAHQIVDDETLTAGQKKTQLLLLLKDVSQPELYNFFSDLFADHQFWLFSSENFDYFDEFVQNFQQQIEKIGIVFMAVALDLQTSEVRDFAQQFGQLLNRHVVISVEVKPAILGGALVRIENLVFDHSLRSKFQQFQRQWIASLTKTSKLVEVE